MLLKLRLLYSLRSNSLLLLLFLFFLFKKEITVHFPLKLYCLAAVGNSETWSFMLLFFFFWIFTNGFQPDLKKKKKQVLEVLFTKIFKKHCGTLRWVCRSCPQRLKHFRHSIDIKYQGINAVLLCRWVFYYLTSGSLKAPYIWTNHCRNQDGGFFRN